MTGSSGVPTKDRSEFDSWILIGSRVANVTTPRASANLLA